MADTDFEENLKTAYTTFVGEDDEALKTENIDEYIKSHQKEYDQLFAAIEGMPWDPKDMAKSVKDLDDSLAFENVCDLMLWCASSGDAKATEFLKAAADAGYPRGQVYYANALSKNLTVDNDEVRSYFKQAITNPHLKHALVLKDRFQDLNKFLRNTDPVTDDVYEEVYTWDDKGRLEKRQIREKATGLKTEITPRYKADSEELDYVTTVESDAKGRDHIVLRADDKGHRLSDEEWVYVGEATSADHIIENSYDDKGYLKDQETFFFDKTHEVIRLEKRHYEYDDGGNLAAKKIEIKDADNKLMSTQEDIKTPEGIWNQKRVSYNSDGSIKSTEYFKSSDGHTYEAITEEESVFHSAPVLPAEYTTFLTQLKTDMDEYQQDLVNNLGSNVMDNDKVLAYITAHDAKYNQLLSTLASAPKLPDTLNPEIKNFLQGPELNDSLIHLSELLDANNTKAIDAMKTLADKGYPRAQVFYAHHLSLGEGIDKAEVSKYWELASKSPYVTDDVLAIPEAVALKTYLGIEAEDGGEEAGEVSGDPADVLEDDETTVETGSAGSVEEASSVGPDEILSETSKHFKVLSPGQKSNWIKNSTGLLKSEYYFDPTGLSKDDFERARRMLNSVCKHVDDDFVMPKEMSNGEKTISSGTKVWRVDDKEDIANLKRFWKKCALSEDLMLGKEPEIGDVGSTETPKKTGKGKGKSGGDKGDPWKYALEQLDKRLMGNIGTPEEFGQTVMFSLMAFPIETLDGYLQLLGKGKGGGKTEEGGDTSPISEADKKRIDAIKRFLEILLREKPDICRELIDKGIWPKPGETLTPDERMRRMIDGFTHDSDLFKRFTKEFGDVAGRHPEIVKEWFPDGYTGSRKPEDLVKVFLGWTRGGHGEGEHGPGEHGGSGDGKGETVIEYDEKGRPKKIQGPGVVLNLSNFGNISNSANVKGVGNVKLSNVGSPEITSPSGSVGTSTIVSGAVNADNNSVIIQMIEKGDIVLSGPEAEKLVEVVKRITRQSDAIKKTKSKLTPLQQQLMEEHPELFKGKNRLTLDDDENLVYATGKNKGKKVENKDLREKYADDKNVTVKNVRSTLLKTLAKQDALGDPAVRKKMNSKASEGH